MSNEIIKDELLTGSVNFLEDIQISSKNKIYTDREISKVLFVKGFASVLHIEVLDEQAHVSGKVKTNISFLSTDGEPVNAEAEVEFNEVIKDEKIKQGDEICVRANVIDCTLTSVSVSEIEVNNIIQLSSKLISQEKISFVTGGGDGLYVLDEPFTSNFLTKSGKQQLTFDIEVQTKENVTQILSSSCKLNLESVKVKGDITEVEGTVCYSLFVKDDQLKIINDEAVINEEVVLEGASENAQVVGKLNVLSCETEFADNKIMLKISAELCYDIYEEKTLNFISDAFSTSNEINLGVISALQNRFAYGFSDQAEIVGNISVNDESFEIRKVIGALPKLLQISKVEAGEEEIALEGIATITAVYEDVNDEIGSVDVEIPFACNAKCDEVKTNQLVSVDSCLLDIKAKIRKANEIEISASVANSFKIFEKNEFAYVNNIEIGEEKPNDESALTIYVVKQNETMFDIAKKLSIGLSSLKEQNPALDEELHEGIKLVVYKQKNVN